jgi:hypothetical protein
MKTPRELDRAIETSHALDDAGPLHAVEPSLRAVHQALLPARRQHPASHTASASSTDHAWANIPWVKSRPDAIEHVIGRISGNARARSPWHSAPKWAMAASVVIAGGLLISALLGPQSPKQAGQIAEKPTKPFSPVQGTPTPSTPDRTIALASGEALSPLDALLNAPASVDRAIDAAFDEPLRAETARLGEDAARAARGVLARLPVRWE